MQVGGIFPGDGTWICDTTNGKIHKNIFFTNRRDFRKNTVASQTGMLIPVTFQSYPIHIHSYSAIYPLISSFKSSPWYHHNIPKIPRGFNYPLYIPMSPCQHRNIPFISYDNYWLSHQFYHHYYPHFRSFHDLSWFIHIPFISHWYSIHIPLIFTNIH